MRANSNLGRGKKSVSIVSLSPSDGMTYGKDSVYNPYSKSINNKKIHLPYLKKNRRALPKMRSDGSKSRRRIEREAKEMYVYFLSLIVDRNICL